MKARLVRLLAATAFLVVGAAPVGAAAPARDDCRTLLVALPVGTSSCPGVRPGAPYYGEDGSLRCSMGFIFRGSDRRDYATSAGHCIWATSNLSDPPGTEAKWKPGDGLVVADAEGRPIGRFAYGVWTDNRDFSLIRLEPGVRPNPAMCYFGGPTSMYKAHEAGPVFLKHFGNGQVVSEVIPARTAVALDTRDQYAVYAYSAGVPGDSGSGVMTSDGKAVGTLVSLHTGTAETEITRLDESIERAAHITGIRYTLRTAALEPDVVRL